MQSWGTYYQRKKISVGDFMRSLAGHAPLFDAMIAEKPARILEVGSGTGIMAIFLSWLGYDVTSVDNDQQVLADAEALTKQLHGTCRYAKADAFALSKAYAGESYDVAFSQGFFEHFSDADIKKLLLEQLAVSRAVIFSVPSKAYGILDFGNERLMTPDEWKSSLSGFRVDYIDEYHQKARGLKTAIRLLLLRPWQLYPWRQYEHLLIKVSRA